MVGLYRLKTLTGRFGVAVGVAVGELKPLSRFALHNQNQLEFVRHLTTTTTTTTATTFPPEISPPNKQDSNFTVNYLINSCGLSPEGAISASKRLNLKSPERADRVLGHLRNNGLSKTQISKLVRSCPKVLVRNPEKTILPKIDYLRSTGVSREDLPTILVYNPTLLGMSLQKRIIPAFDFLTSMLSHKNVVAVFKHCSRIFLEGHSKNVEPNIGLLRELGMPQSCISLLLAHYSRALVREPEKFGQVVKEVKQMGFDFEKSYSVMAISVLSGTNSQSIWNRSRQVYMTRWGWSEDDVLSAFRKFPICMVFSEKKIMQVMELLVDKMGWPSRVIAECPVVLGYSLDKRIIPRCLVVQVLLMKGFINEIENVSLYSLICPTEKYFLERFVANYIDKVPQLLSVYQGQLGVEDV